MHRLDIQNLRGYWHCTFYTPCSLHPLTVNSFVPLVPEKHTSFASRISMTQDNTMDLFKYLNADPSFITNLLGRPDYWAPQTRWTSDSNSNILACGPIHLLPLISRHGLTSTDFYCQHPRWNLHFQGAPLSVYLRYDAALRLTSYIISHKEGDSNIQALQNIFNLAIKRHRQSKEHASCSTIRLTSPSSCPP